VRDLSLRSAASVGSFQLIPLLYDEYMFFIIDRKVALETGDSCRRHGKEYNNQSNLSDFVHPGLCNGGLSLTEEISVNVGTKMASKPVVVGTNLASL
jgi:hypothetical protein